MPRFTTPTAAVSLCLMLGLVAGAMSPALAQDATEPPAAQEEAALEGPPIAGIPLRQQMVLIQGALSRIATDAPYREYMSDALADIEEVQRRIIEAKNATPPDLGHESEAEREQHRLAYRSLFAEMLLEVTSLETAVIEQSSKKIEASLERLLDFREKGHAAFQEPRPERGDRPKVELKDQVQLRPGERRVYAGVYEMVGMGFRMEIVEINGALHVQSFGQEPERMYAQGEHRFKIAVAPSGSFRFEISDDGNVMAIMLETGGGRPPQRIDRIR